jgi:N-methylhydantoinase A/oxoprolinase/acetone carboxylase beta subunit
MYLALVGCSIFKHEVEYLKDRIKSKLDFYWLPQRLHSKPLELRRLIREEIGKIDRSGKPYDAIALLYGVCSKGTVGIYSEHYDIVIPRVQDCIAILLGSRERYVEHFKNKPGTYWFTRGWIETGFSPGKKTEYEGVYDPYRERYREYRKKFNRSLARYLIDEWDQRWIRNYTTLAFIDWGIEGDEAFRKEAEENARGLGLEYEHIKGDPGLLLNLLNGHWDERDFLRVKPGYKIMPSYADDVLTTGGQGIGKTMEGPQSTGGKTGVTGKREGLGIGIDAGGTYTDAVLYDFNGDEVIGWSKAITTHDDYSVGISNALDELLSKVGAELTKRISLVSLSTTLATNAIVEGKGGRVGLILIGYDQHTLKKIDLHPRAVIRGKYTINGEEIEPLDSQEAVEAIGELLRKGVDAFAVSSEVGVRNPEHELKVKALIRGCCDLPVVCSSELSSELNCVKRANTSFFNARLIPLVTNLLKSVKKVLRKRGIDAPIMVVKGDGTLMSERVAMEKPIEMVLSGPAASVMGGAYLSGVQNGYVVDMGGTTTDAAVVRDGFVTFKKEGISIEGFRTTVKTIDVHTFGLGGDSYIRYDSRKGGVKIGPERVVPLSYLALRYPEVLKGLKAKRGFTSGEEMLVQPVNFFLFQKGITTRDLHPQEKAILKLLKEKGPLDQVEIAERVGAPAVSLLRTERLELYGNIIRSSLTPTDLLHAAGRVNFWNREASEEGVRIYAERAGCSSAEFIDMSWREFYRLLIYQLFTFLFREESDVRDEEVFSYNLSRHLLSDRGDIRIRMCLTKPIIFIGAPAEVYGEGMEQFVDLDVRVPVHYPVANAIGAITGAVRENVIILIRPEEGRGFVAFTPDGKKCFASLNEAKDEVSELARRMVIERAKMAGARHLMVNVEVDDRKVKLSEDEEIYLETLVKASISSVPLMKPTGSLYSDIS